MSQTKEQGAGIAREKLTAESIINQLGTQDDIETMRENIRDLWDNFVIFNDTSDADDRGQMFVTYKALDEVLVLTKALLEQEIPPTSMTATIDGFSMN